jgi:hypothetical protein
MKKKILKKIAKLVKLLPDHKFDMDSWAEKKDCGTTFCAIGSAASLGIIPNVKLDEHYDVIWTCPKTGKQLESWEAVAESLDITEDQAEFLFYSHSYDHITQKAVHDRIMEFIETHSNASETI